MSCVYAEEHYLFHFLSENILSLVDLLEYHGDQISREQAEYIYERAWSPEAKH